MTSLEKAVNFGATKEILEIFTYLFGEEKRKKHPKIQILNVSEAFWSLIYEKGCICLAFGQGTELHVLEK